MENVHIYDENLKYQSLIEVNARTTDCVLRLLYPQPVVMSSEQFVNKRA